MSPSKGVQNYFASLKQSWKVGRIENCVVVNWPFLKKVHSTQIKPRLWLSLRGSITAAGEEEGAEASENTKEPED